MFPASVLVTKTTSSESSSAITTFVLNLLFSHRSKGLEVACKSGCGISFCYSCIEHYILNLIKSDLSKSYHLESEGFKMWRPTSFLGYSSFISSLLPPNTAAGWSYNSFLYDPAWTSCLAPELPTLQHSDLWQNHFACREPMHQPPSSCLGLCAGSKKKKKSYFYERLLSVLLIILFFYMDHSISLDSSPSGNPSNLKFKCSAASNGTLVLLIFGSELNYFGSTLWVDSYSYDWVTLLIFFNIRSILVWAGARDIGSLGLDLVWESP